MNRAVPLVSTPAVTLEWFEHVPGVRHHDPEEERASSHAISFVEGGSFDVGMGGAWREVTPRHVLTTTPGLPFSCRHQDDYPEDRCLVVRFTEETVESLRGAGATAVPEPVLPLTNRRAYLRLALTEHREHGFDPARAEALAGALYWTLGGGPRTPAPLFREHQLAWYVTRLRRAKEQMQALHAEPLALSHLAREAGMSLYHFARVFHELEGQPPHRYLVEIRLQEAHRRLRAGQSVTDTCHAVGFGSLSHFVTRFRRKFGVRPGALGPKKK